MILWLGDPAVPNDPAVFDALSSVLTTVWEGRHQLMVPDEDVILRSRWCTEDLVHRRQRELAEHLRHAVDDAITLDRALDPVRAPERPHVRIMAETGPHGTLHWQLSPADARTWAHSPLELVLENDDDIILLRLAASVYQQDWLEAALAKGWMRCSGKGGKDEVRKYVDRASVLDRLFVFIDSDRATRDGPPGGSSTASTTQQRVETACRARPCSPCHLTAAREMENYIPDRLIKPRATTTRHKEAKDFATTWLAASEEQRRYLKLKGDKGFGDQWIKPIFQSLLTESVTREELESTAGSELCDILSSLKEHL